MDLNLLDTLVSKVLGLILGMTQICFTIILPNGQNYGKTNLSRGLRPRNYN